MKYKFLKPAKGWAYFPGDIASLPGDAADPLVKQGFIIPFTGEEENALPEDLPCRALLWRQGMTSVADVRKYADTLHELPGMTKKMSETIKQWLYDHQEN